MTYTFYLLIMNSLFCVGLHILTRHEVYNGQHSRQPLWWIDVAATRISPTLAKPVCSCLVCMASIHSVIPFWFQISFNSFSVGVYVFYVIALAGLNGIASRLIP